MFKIQENPLSASLSSYLSTNFLEQGKRNSRLYTHFWSNYLKPMRKDSLPPTVHIVYFFNRLQTLKNKNHIRSITNSPFSYHTTSLLPILRAEMETALGVRNQQQLERGAPGLKPPEGRVSEECWRNLSKLLVLMRVSCWHHHSSNVSLPCNCLPASKLWIWQGENATLTAILVPWSAALVCGRLTK